ncbi:MAG: ferric reductase-like transmembrane domain-containing protein [Candidatus Thermoplasmatota archaeon]|nr:ferric reductase-like transmembrane domain-containing protein [Candidatus Thermoplasmatota archaeon]
MGNRKGISPGRFLGFLPLELFNGLKLRQMVTPGSAFFLLLVLSPMIIWLSHNPDSVRDPLIAVAKTCAFMAISTLSVNYILAARFRLLENAFGGLDRMYRVHKAVGRSSLFFMLLHPIFLGLSRLPDLDLIATYILPIGPLDVSLGVISLYLFIILLGITVAVKLSYHVWHISHKFMGVVLVLAAVHALMAGSDLGSYPILRFWVVLISTAGALSWIYMFVFYQMVGPRYSVAVTKVKQHKDITDLHIEKPEDFDFQPGQFIYLRFPRFEGYRELHPFSISNDPSQKDLRISIRRSGDHTSERIPLVEKGDRVIMMGPYGKFGARYFRHDRDMVWIAGGIGITPFLSLAKHESLFPTGRKVILIWAFQDPEDSIYDGELSAESRRNPKFRYIPWVSSRKGRIDADKVSRMVGGDGELKKRTIMMCGPPGMVTSLSGQFHSRGIPYRNMLFEDFDMLD